MKRLLGMAILALGLAGTLNAQAMHGGMSASTTATSGGGGGGVGGSGYGGGASRPQNCPATRFSVASFSGSQQEYVPSTFISYDKAISTGKEVMEAPQPTVAEASREVSSIHAEKAKFALVQDIYGHPMIVRQ